MTTPRTPSHRPGPALRTLLVGAAGIVAVGAALAWWAASAGAPAIVSACALAGAVLYAFGRVLDAREAATIGAEEAARARAERAAESERLREVASALVELRGSFVDQQQAVYERTTSAISDACERAFERSGERAAAAMQAPLVGLRETLEHTARAIEAAAPQLERVAARADQTLEERQRLEREHLEALAAMLDATANTEERRAESLHEQWVELSNSLAAQWREATAGLERTLGAASARDEQRVAELAAIVEAVRADSQATAASLRARAERDDAAAAAFDERMIEIFATLTDGATAIREAGAEQARAALDLTQAADARAEAAATRSAEHVAAFAKQMIQAVERHQEQMSAFERNLLEMHRAAFDAAGATLRDYAVELAQTAGRTIEATTDATDAVRAGGAELAAAAEMFTEAVERHRDAANLWLESLGVMEGAIEKAGESAAADALGEHLTSTHELFTQQLELHRELYEQMRAMRGAVAAAAAAAPVAEPLADDERATA